MRFTHFGTTYEGKIEYNKYQNNGNLAVQLLSKEDGEDYFENYASLSVNTDLKLPANQFVAKTYSENEGLIEQFIDNGTFVRTNRSVECGHAGKQPVLQLAAVYPKGADRPLGLPPIGQTDD